MSILAFKTNINKYINYFLIGLVFVIPISYHWRDIILGVIILLWIFEGNFKNKYLKLKNNINVALIMFLSVYILRFLSNLWSDSFIDGSFKTSHYFNSFDYVIRHDFFYIAIIPIILTSFNVKYTKKIITSFIFGMLVSEITSYGIIFGFWTTKHGTPYNPTPFMSYHSTYSLLLVIAIFWLLHMAFIEKEKLKKLFYSIFFLTATLNLFYNAGRTGQVIFFILLAFFLIYHFKLSFKTIVGFLFISIFSFFLLFNISKIFQKRVYQAQNDIEKVLKGDFASSWGGRTMAWFVAKDIFLKYPILGVGVGDIKKDIWKDSEKYGKKNSNFFKHSLPHLHNQFLQILIETGIIGFSFFILFWIYFLKERYNKDIEYFIYSFILIYLIAFLTEVFLMKPMKL